MIKFDEILTETFTSTLEEDVEAEANVLMDPFIHKLDESKDLKTALMAMFPEKMKDVSDMLEFYEIEYDALIGVMIDSLTEKGDEGEEGDGKKTKHKVAAVKEKAAKIKKKGAPIEKSEGDEGEEGDGKKTKHKVDALK